MASTIRRNDRSIQMAGCPTSEEHDQTGNILGSTQSLVGGMVLERLQPTLEINQAIGHLRREEARGNGIAQDMPGTQLDSQVLGQMNDRRLGSRVAESGVLPETTDAQSSNRASDDDS